MIMCFNVKLYSSSYISLSTIYQFLPCSNGNSFLFLSHVSFLHFISFCRHHFQSQQKCVIVSGKRIILTHKTHNFLWRYLYFRTVSANVFRFYMRLFVNNAVTKCIACKLAYPDSIIIITQFVKNDIYIFLWRKLLNSTFSSSISSVCSKFK